MRAPTTITVLATPAIRVGKDCVAWVEGGRGARVCRGRRRRRGGFSGAHVRVRAAEGGRREGKGERTRCTSCNADGDGCNAKSRQKGKKREGDGEGRVNGGGRKGRAAIVKVRRSH